MKKGIIGLSLMLTISLIPAYSAIPPKAGSICSKLGITKSYQGKKFTCIKSGKKLVWSKGVVIKSPSPSPTPTPTPSPSPSPTSSPSPTPATFEPPKPTAKPITYESPEDLSVCRIPQKDRNPNLPFYSYPIDEKSIYAFLPRSGQINVTVIPIDFSDAPGSSKPSAFLNSQMELIDEWMLWYSHGRSFYKWKTHDEWIRAPKSSSDYVPIDTPGPTRGLSNDGRSQGSFIGTRSLNTFENASELLDLAKSHFDFDSMNVVLFLFPEGAKNIYDPWVRNGNFQGSGSSRDGTYRDTGIRDKRLENVVILAAGNWFFNQRVSFWPWFLHENLHHQGLLGHAPMQGSPLGIMTSQAGIRLPLQAWDSITLDWQLPTDIFCVNKQKLAQFEILMSPLEREEVGTKAIMIRLSEYEVLVIESRRDDKWINQLRRGEIINADSDGRSNKLNGLVVYKVQMDKVEPYGTIDADGPNWKDSSTNFAYYIRNNIKEKGYSEYSGVPPFDLNFMIYEGESLTYQGIKISLLASGLHDKVRVERNS